VARFVYSPDYLDAVARQERDLNADSDFSDTDEVIYYHSNTLYSIYALTDATESVVERYRYDAYGAVSVLDADGSDDTDGFSDAENPYAFTGRRLDLESALMQYRNRYYSAEVGRFMSRDPSGYNDGRNLYPYIGDHPRNGLDPLGLWAVSETHEARWISLVGVTKAWFMVVAIGYTNDKCHWAHSPSVDSYATCSAAWPLTFTRWQVNESEFTREDMGSCCPDHTVECFHIEADYKLEVCILVPWGPLCAEKDTGPEGVAICADGETWLTGVAGDD